MYELARKHCGDQREWKISLALLQKKCASASTLKEFRRLVLGIVKKDQTHHHMPDYSVTIDENDMVKFINRGGFKKKTGNLRLASPLKADTYEQAKLAAPGLDVYALEQDWRASFASPPKYPDAAFVGFCRSRFERFCHA